MRGVMRAPLLLVLLGASLAACSSSSGGDVPSVDAGGAAFTYTPAGCAYGVSPPDSRAFTGLALDDGAAPGDPAGAAPVRVRVGLGGGTTAGAPGYADPTTSAAFTWETVLAFNGAKVRLGNAPGALSDVHTGYSWALGASTFHEAHVCGLTAGKTYYYQVGGGASGAEVWSATQTFTTVPDSGPITIGVSGDARDSATTFQLVNQRMRDAAVAFQLFSGDLVLLGTTEGFFSQWLDEIWKDPNDATKFLTLGQQLFLPVGGNHEAQAAPYYANFALPGEGPYAESFASFDVQTVHFVLLDDQAIADTIADEATAHLAWLEADLAHAEANRTKVPFLVVVHHRGEFSTSMHNADPDVVQARASLVPVWDKHHVDLVLNGHDHNYERTKPVTGPVASPVVAPSTTTGTTYVVCAGAGADAYPPGTTPAAYRQTNTGFGTGTPYVGVYSLLTIDKRTLTYKAYGLTVAGGSVAGDTLIDSFALQR